MRSSNSSNSRTMLGSKLGDGIYAAKSVMSDEVHLDASEAICACSSVRTATASRSYPATTV
eukprot:1497946-Amphidinium_carterae.1